MENNKTGLFYGSDTGITEEITHIINDSWDQNEIVVHEIGDVGIKDFEPYDFIFLGLSTWYDGDLQSDWESFFDEFKNIDFNGKTIAIYGLGDQYGYAEYFIDGVGIIAKTILKQGGTIIGHWPVEEYDHTESLAEIGDGNFYGLALDNDNQAELTEPRIIAWLTQVKEALRNQSK